MRKWLIFAALLLGLAGCATTPEERAARMRAEMEGMMATYGPACERLGFKPDDDRWRDCVLRLAQRDELRYSRYPMTTTCFGSRGFYHCSLF